MALARQDDRNEEGRKEGGDGMALVNSKRKSAIGKQKKMHKKDIVSSKIGRLDVQIASVNSGALKPFREALLGTSVQ